MNKILVCVGARPNLMKASSLFQASKAYPNLKIDLLHTGQHYSSEMDQVFFEQFSIPTPNYQLNVGSGTHATQTAEIMKKFEPVVVENQYDLVAVIGDINSTAACALVASKLHIPVAHIEAGLRSFDMKMPEEVNRKIADHLSDYLFTTEQSGDENLKNEGVSENKIFFVGNTMIDTLVTHLGQVKQTHAYKDYNCEPGQYSVLTLHRPSNVDGPENFLNLLEKISRHTIENYKIIFPAHPRTQKVMESLSSNVLEKFIVIPAQPYFSFMSLVYHSAMVMTDSGGIQEETTYLKKPCFTLRENTERPVTTKIGSNFLIGTDLHKIPEKMESFDSKNHKYQNFGMGKQDIGF